MSYFKLLTAAYHLSHIQETVTFMLHLVYSRNKCKRKTKSCQLEYTGYSLLFLCRHYIMPCWYRESRIPF